MIRVVIPGGSYAECHPSGVYAVLVGTDVIVTDGLVRHNQFGSDVPLHLRATSAGTFAGQGHDSGRVIRWNGSQWIAEGTTCGVNACAFTPDGVLVVNDHCQHGTQGIRWIEPDGTIVTGDATYDGRLTEGVAEWTRHGNVVVGQSYVDGCTIHRDFDVPRQLEPGHCTFVRFNRAGNKCAVALWKQLEQCAVLFWFDVSEITSLKPEPVDPPPPPPPPPPIDPERPVKIPQKVKDNIVALYERHKNLAQGSDDDRRALMKLITEQNAHDLGPMHGWKSADPGRPPSKDGIGYSTTSDDSSDVYVADVFNGTTREPSVPDEYDRTDPRQHFIRMDPVNHLGTVVDPDPDPDPDVNAKLKALEDKLLTKIMDAELRVTQSLVGQVSTIAGEINRLDERIDHLPSGETFDPSKYKARTPVRAFGINLGTFDGELVKK